MLDNFKKRYLRRYAAQHFGVKPSDIEITYMQESGVAPYAGHDFTLEYSLFFLEQLKVDDWTIGETSAVSLVLPDGGGYDLRFYHDDKQLHQVDLLVRGIDRQNVTNLTFSGYVFHDKTPKQPQN